MRTIQFAFAVAASLAIGCGFDPEGVGNVGPGIDLDGGPEDTGSGGSGGAGGAGSRDGSQDRAIDRALDAPADVAQPPADARPDVAPPEGPADGRLDAPPDVPLLPRVLLAVGAEPLGTGDTLVQDRLVSLGFRVRAMPGRNREEAMAIRDAAMADGKLIVLSSSLPQGTGLATLLQPLAIPVLCAKSELLDNLGIGFPIGDVTPLNTEIAIIMPAHALAAGRSGTIAVALQATPFGWGRPLDNAVSVATESGNRDHVIVFGFERGAITPSGPTPARRVAWLALEQTFRSLNAVGWALFDTAVRWATGNI